MLEIGAIVEGKVTGLTTFGAFVSLPEGKSGMVHISEVSNTFVKDIKEHLKEGQEVKVKVVGITDEGKISLSIKKAMDPPAKDSQPRQKRPRDRQRNTANVWQGQAKPQSSDNMSFEEMMARFKQVSDEKMTDLRRSNDSYHGGYFRKGKNNN